MKIAFEIIKTTKRTDESIDYKTIVFKLVLEKIIDLDSSRDLGALFEALVDGGAVKILLDMTGLEYIDSMGIGTVISSAKLVRKKRGDVVMIGVTPDLDKIFRVVNLHRVIKMFDTEDEALNFFRYV
ncbi:MAG TPA: STAS domain-containing protein [Spirochaetota bacterium]|nr:STAS domain-containing protein [Spirochaetota bacterium]HNT09837.1 STAS domain-containing protein [Spirochaetota bacterium]HNV46303.1 STAS domain-containing protein [Spirochaetota bacterium]HOS38116.1 STAS domain-containing protein [Spirochaetota bacterium]HPI21586.1 STAS domain-containing protein [Spirochaetota bacterium]